MAVEFGLGTPPGVYKLNYMGENRISPIYFTFNGVPCGQKCSLIIFGDGGTFSAAKFGWRTPPDVYKLKYMSENRISPIYFIFNGVPCGPNCFPIGFCDRVTFLAAKFRMRTSPGVHKLIYMGENRFSPIYFNFNGVSFG